MTLRRPLTETERNFVGWAVRRIDDEIMDLVETALIESPELSLPTDEDERDEYTDLIFDAVYKELGDKVRKEGL